MSLTLRNVELHGRTICDVRLERGRIAGIGQRLPRDDDEIDARGGALLPGLIDHHAHLFALAAQLESVSLDPARVSDRAALAAALRAARRATPRGRWLRGFGYHECIAGALDRDVLDQLLPDRPLRVQHRGGALWMLNSAALAALPATTLPPGAERDARGRPNGRFWREDAWLRAHLPAGRPDLRQVGEMLSGYGITGVTDASPGTDAAAAAMLSAALGHGKGGLRLNLMSGEMLAAPADGGYRVGPVKIMLDEAALGDLDAMLDAIARARAWRRAVAVHCVTAVELAYALAAFTTAGALPGDRIEHGGVIDDDAAALLARLGLTVVTQPGFVSERGDRYLSDVDSRDQPFLYRAAGLMLHGVRVAGSSDAPYASPDPWRAMSAAVRRRTRAGRVLGAAERLDPQAALKLFLGSFDDPGGPSRTVARGENADLCLMHAPLRVVLNELSADLVATTLVGGIVASPVSHDHARAA